MIEIIACAVVVALTTNVIMMLPFWQELKKYGKPFSCSYCLAFYFSVIIGLFDLHALGDVQMLLMTLSAPYLSVLFERLLASLPIKL